MHEDVSNILKLTANQISYSANLLADMTMDWQVIKEYLSNRLNNLVLTETQQKKLDRYNFIYNQTLSGKYSKQQVLNMTMEKFQICHSQACKDANATSEIFSTIITINKKFELQLELESAKDMKRKCIALNDFKTAALIQKNIIAIIDQLPEEVDDAAAKFEGHFIEAVFDPRLLGAPEINMTEVLNALNAKRKVKIKTDLFENLSFQSDNEKPAAL